MSTHTPQPSIWLARCGVRRDCRDHGSNSGSRPAACQPCAAQGSSRRIECRRQYFRTSKGRRSVSRSSRERRLRRPGRGGAYRRGAAHPGAPREVRGARNWAHGAVAFSQTARFAQVALVDGSVGIIFAPDGKLSRVLRLTIAGGKITQADLIAEPARLRELELAVL